MSEAVKVMVRCRPINQKELDRGISPFIKVVKMLWRWTHLINRSIYSRKIVVNNPNLSHLIMSSAQIVRKVSSMNRQPSPWLIMYLTDTMAPSLPMDKLVAARRTPWWAAMNQNRAKVSFLEPSVRSWQSPKTTQAKPISSDVVLSRSIMNKFMICSAKMSRLGWS